jgi:ERF superfamily
MMSESIAKISPALIKARAAFNPAVKDGTNPHFGSKFVSLAGVITAIDLALDANGLIVLQPTRIGDDGKTVLVTTLLHESGEWIAGEYPVTAAKQNDPQAEGSAMTYARRYALMAMVGIAPEDDDGNAASAAAKPARPSKPVVKPDFNRQIAAASNPDGLAKVGAAIAAAEMTPEERTTLRASFSARMAEVRT